MINKEKNLPKPIPCGGIEFYNKERKLCLSLNEQKKENYDKYLLNKESKKSILDYLPIKLDIENVSRCNFRCQMCQVSKWEKGKRAEDMTFESFKNLIDEQYGVVELKIQGMGEPVLGRDEYFKMIRYARDQHIWVRTVTNASILHKSENYKKIIDSDVNELQISIDGSTKEVFEKIRHKANFEKIIENCKLVNLYSKKVNKQVTKMWTVVQKDNFHQLEDLVDLAAELHFPSMVFSFDIGDWGQENWTQANLDLRSNAISYEQGMSLREKGAKLGVEVYFWYLDSKYDKDNICPWPFERAYVSSDMRIVPCCMIANPEVEDLGDAKEFSKAWNGDKYENFRQSHINGDIPKYCKSCYSNK
jgi:pyrroloquinoline quinone biosynthesis protein E